MKQHLKRLRKQLPYRFAPSVSKMLNGISERQVHAVFRGEITNPQIVDQVLAAAIKLRDKRDSQNRLLIKKIKPAHKRTSKRAA